MSEFAVDRARWATMSVCEQMANVGAEVGRAMNALRQGKDKRARAAADRAIDLFDATAQAWAHRRPERTREVLRARDEFIALMYGDASDVDADRVERYYSQFAYAARCAR